MSKHQQQAKTLLEAVRESLARAGRHNPNVEVAPVAVLWTDVDRQWQTMIPALRELMPELLTLGEYDPETRTGPAIWLRCVIESAVRAEKFPELAWPEDAIPIIYMPGVSRQTLRAVEECPDALKPLVELQYRGTVWTQKNGKDWSVRAFLVSDDGGLGLDVAEDRRTLEAVLGALSELSNTPLSRLTGRRLEAEDFDRLMVRDTARDILSWLNDPQQSRQQWDGTKWSAFCNRCRQEYEFDPEADGELTGGQLLGLREDAWFGVWERFVESPRLYPGIPDLLRRAKPKDLFVDRDAWPDEAESMERALRDALKQVGSMSASDARQRLQELETEHGVRRGWVWASLDMCPLAEAMEHLALLAKYTQSALGGNSLEMMASRYVENGYLADDAAMRALACVNSADDCEAVKIAVQCVYLPWLEDTAMHFQKLLDTDELPAVADQDAVEASAGECILFVDGLRFDLGQRLVAMATERQYEISNTWRWSAVPSVTSTAKPAVAPVVELLRGGRMNSEFRPELIDGGQEVTTDRFRKLLAVAGYQVTGPAEVGDPTDENALAWSEYGEFDKLGHDMQAKLAMRIDDQLELLMDRVKALLDAGWKRVQVVTDHGWLLVPGGMPKVDLPKYLTESRWSRCASIKDSSHVDVPVLGWSWNPQERFASAPGVHCFVSGQEYAHGGASLQECVVPILTIASSVVAAEMAVSIAHITWGGLRCRILVEPAQQGLKADLRTKPNDPSSSILDGMIGEIDNKGKVALYVENDSLEETMVSLVIFDESGRVICKEATTVGGDR